MCITLHVILCNFHENGRAQSLIHAFDLVALLVSGGGKDFDSETSWGWSVKDTWRTGYQCGLEVDCNMSTYLKTTTALYRSPSELNSHAYQLENPFTITVACKLLSTNLIHICLTEQPVI